MHRSSLPNVKGNLVITHSTPNVSRSWSSREVRVRSGESLARSVGDGDRERRVLEWCTRNNVNMVRKLPKLDSAILTARGINTDKFMTFVREEPIVKKGPRAKPYDPIKERKSEEVVKSIYCQYCQRKMPSNKPRRRPVFFTSPYECEYCGASNDIVDTNDNDSSEDSESTNDTETVHDTIRRGNPAHVIDHRTFHEKTAKVTEECDSAVNEEMDIFWRDDASEYFEHVNNAEDEMTNLSVHGEQTVFLTEASVSTVRPSQAKIAWDNEGSIQFAEINRTITTDDRLQKKDVQRSENVQSKSFERLSDKENAGVCLFQENDMTSDMKIRISCRTKHSDGDGDDESPDSGEKVQAGPSNIEHLKSDSDCNRNQLNNSFENATIRSPVANQSVTLSRLALLRLNRANRLRSKSPRSSPGTQRRVSKPQEPQTHSFDSFQSSSFLDAVSPEIKSIHENKKFEKEDEETRKQK